MRAPSPWVLPLSEPTERRARRSLLCLPYAGGGASVYRAWPTLLARELDVRVVGLQPPGRETRIGEPPIRQLATLLDALVEATRTERDRPYALFGHSLGALTAFELTRALRRRGERLPAVLLVSGCPAPQRSDPERSFGELDDAAFIERLRRFEGTPDAVLAHPELLELLLPTLRADLGLRDGYRCAEEPPLALPIVAFGGDADPDVSAPDLLAWSVHTTAGFRARRFPGGHFYLKSEARALLACVSQELAAVFGDAAAAHPIARKEATGGLSL